MADARDTRSLGVFTLEKKTVFFSSLVYLKGGVGLLHFCEYQAFFTRVLAIIPAWSTFLLAIKLSCSFPQRWIPRRGLTDSQDALEFRFALESWTSLLNSSILPWELDQPSVQQHPLLKAIPAFCTAASSPESWSSLLYSSILPCLSPTSQSNYERTVYNYLPSVYCLIVLPSELLAHTL